MRIKIERNGTYFYYVPQVREIRLRGSPRFRNKVGRNAHPHFASCYVRWKLLSSSAINSLRSTSSPRDDTRHPVFYYIPIFLQKFCKKIAALLRRLPTTIVAQTEKREGKRDKAVGKTRRDIISSNRSTIDTIAARRKGLEEEREGRSLLSRVTAIGNVKP